MGSLDGRVVVVTGAGRGVGRAHALFFASEGARVVVNDLGGGPDGAGADRSAAQQVAEEIRSAGGEAVANHDNVADWDGARRLVEQAVDAFGDLHCVVNNAGILRDRMLVNMSEDEWDAVVAVHLKGTFCVSRFAASYWRERSKDGTVVDRSVVNTSSTSGLFGAPGQTNYGAAKSAIATFSIIASRELQRYGVRVNCIAPTARTRLTENIPMMNPVQEGFDAMDPGNLSPFVAYLCTGGCRINGKVFHVVGGRVNLFKPWEIVDSITISGRWTVAELAEQADRFADIDFGDLGRMALGS
jgi:NAD(P)-dependent dehydrogenase (short-subunit alcohol dehydrogenase family)